MSNVSDALLKREFMDTDFKINDHTFPVKVRVFTKDKFNQEVNYLKNATEEENAIRFCSYFYDPDSMEPCFSPDLILQQKIKAADINRLMAFWTRCNLGAEGN